MSDTEQARQPTRLGQRHADLVAFLEDLMRRKNRRACPMAKEIRVSHPTMSRWLSGEDVPSTASCHKLAEHSGAPLQKVLALAGHVPDVPRTLPADWPDFGEYARRKYPQLDEDLIAVMEGYIERRRGKH